VVNTVVPAISYLNWFSYQTDEFISENREVQRSIRTTRWVFPGRKIRFVMDSGGDHIVPMSFGRKPALFGSPMSLFSPAKHMDWLVEVYHARLDRRETEHLQDLVDCVPWQVTYQVAFQHAGCTRLADLKMGCFQIRLPETQQQLWALVTEDNFHPNTLTLSVPIAQQVYADWRLRSRIEHGYRFDQEQGLDVEDLQVRTVERMRRVFALVLVTAQFIFSLGHHWPPKAVLWLRKLGASSASKPIGMALTSCCMA
jgi:hypothetical protein